MNFRQKFLIWQHAQALNVFHKVQASLARIAESIQKEIAKAQDAISSHKDGIKKQEEAIAHFISHHNKVTSQHAKVSAILE